MLNVQNQLEKDGVTDEVPYLTMVLDLLGWRKYLFCAQPLVDLWKSRKAKGLTIGAYIDVASFTINAELQKVSLRCHLN